MTKPALQDRPKKPKNFPLTAHKCGQWVKKIGKKRYYFGKWSDPDAALAKYKHDFPYLNLGIEPPKGDLLLRDILNAFDDEKTSALESGKITKRTYTEYMAICQTLSDVLGSTCPVEAITPLLLKRVSHKLAMGKNGKPLSPVSHKRTLTFARMVFCFSNEIVGTNIRYRKALRSPEKRLIRERRAARGPLMYTASDVRLLIDKADAHLKAAIYLGINCGFGPGDCIELTTDRIRAGFVDYPRPKTGVDRRCPLWEETQKAIATISNGERVFGEKATLRRPRRTWNRHMLGNDFQELCEECGVTCLGLYSLRRTFETVAKNADVNQSVIDRIMGHERPDMSETYNQRTYDRQLIRCTTFVLDWLNGNVQL